MAAAGLAGFGALVSLALGFLILGEDVAGVVPGRWVAVFVATSVGTFVLLLVAAVTGRRALGLRGWRSAADGRFLWETVLSIVAVVASGLATAVSDRFPGYLCLASILAVYVTLVRWTWWTWRAFG